MRNRPSYHEWATHGRYVSAGWCQGYQDVALRLLGEHTLPEYIALVEADEDGKKHLPVLLNIIGAAGRSDDIDITNPFNEGEYFPREDHPLNHS